MGSRGPHVPRGRPWLLRPGAIARPRRTPVSPAETSPQEDAPTARVARCPVSTVRVTVSAHPPRLPPIPESPTQLSVPPAGAGSGARAAPLGAGPGAELSTHPAAVPAPRPAHLVGDARRASTAAPIPASVLALGALQQARWGGRRDGGGALPAGDAADAAIRAFVATLYAPPSTAAALVEAYHLLREGRSANTLRAIESDLQAWSLWCRDAGRVPLPARAEDVVAYLRARAATHAPSTLRRHLSSITWLHQAARFPSPTADPTVRLALAGTGRSWAAARETAGQGTRPRQAPGLTARAVDAILATFGSAGPTRLIDRRDVALLLVARDLLARRSEIVALRVEDLRPVSRGDDAERDADTEDDAPVRTSSPRDPSAAHEPLPGGATIVIRRSKTDQTGQGTVAYMGPETLAALEAWLDAAAGPSGGALRTGPLFRSVHVTGRVGGALHPEDVADILRKLAQRAARPLRRMGIDADAVSGHSCRVGMAQDLVAAGLELPAIMQAGRWKSSTMVARYAEQLLATHGAIAQYHARRRSHR